MPPKLLRVIYKSITQNEERMIDESAKSRSIGTTEYPFTQKKRLQTVTSETNWLTAHRDKRYYSQ